MPIALDDESEPELVEVADSSLADDRGTKAALYARAETL
jgi:hypothetical protein